MTLLLSTWVCDNCDAKKKEKDNKTQIKAEKEDWNGWEDANDCLSIGYVVKIDGNNNFIYVMCTSKYIISIDYPSKIIKFTSEWIDQNTNIQIGDLVGLNKNKRLVSLNRK